jgi:hypothetical protein
MKTKRQVSKELRQAILLNGYGVNTKIINKNISVDVLVSSALFTQTLIEIIQKVANAHRLQWFVREKLEQSKNSMEAVIYGGGE